MDFLVNYRLTCCLIIGQFWPVSQQGVPETLLSLFLPPSKGNSTDFTQLYNVKCVGGDLSSEKITPDDVIVMSSGHINSALQSGIVEFKRSLLYVQSGSN